MATEVNVQPLDDDDDDDDDDDNERICDQQAMGKMQRAHGTCPLFSKARKHREIELEGQEIGSMISELNAYLNWHPNNLIFLK